MISKWGCCMNIRVGGRKLRLSIYVEKITARQRLEKIEIEAIGVASTRESFSQNSSSLQAADRTELPSY